MEILEFLRGTQRMCNEYNCYDGCPIYGACVFDGINAQSPERVGAIVATVEAWIEANPIKTNAQQFEEVFGLSGHCLIDQNAQWWDEPYKEPDIEHVGYDAEQMGREK